MRLSEHIRKIEARQIVTSRGHPTVEVDFVTDSGTFRSSVPEGASTGSKEAAVILDGAKAYNGRSVKNVVRSIHELSEKLLSVEVQDQDDFDKYLISLDGTPNKKKLGANLILPLSVCFCKWMASFKSLSVYEHIRNIYAKDSVKCRLPSPNFNVLNGGEHSGNGFWCQEIMVTFGSGRFSDSMEQACVFYEALGDVIEEKFGAIFRAVGDEGGFAPPIKTVGEGIELLTSAGGKCDITNFKIAIDFAANTFYKNGNYHIVNKTGSHTLSGGELGDFYASLIDQYPMIYSMEDPFAEDDLSAWSHFYELAGDRINIVADDLTVTNPRIIENLAPSRMFNTVLIKPNQIGSVSETLEAIRVARKHENKIMISHRSGETEDTFICDLAVGIGSEYIKSGAPCRGERIAKYNELLRIEDEIAAIKLKSPFN